ncbi:MAG: signal peptidase I, partial [candidate division NC10 bacterium RBG_16_65_8]
DWPASRLGEREKLGPIVVPPDRLFMMGDNRDHSMDSRVWGLLDIGKVKGKAFVVYFSVRTDDIPYNSPVMSVYHVVSHPGLIRWSRLGNLVH